MGLYFYGWGGGAHRDEMYVFMWKLKDWGIQTKKSPWVITKCVELETLWKMNIGDVLIRHIWAEAVNTNSLSNSMKINTDVDTIITNKKRKQSKSQDAEMRKKLA